jgi:alpha-L-rhamnosidase
MSEIASALGRGAEASKYAAQFDSMTAAFYSTCKSCNVWASCCGARLENSSQTSSIMALALNLAAPPLSQTGGPIPADMVEAVARNLVKRIGQAGNHTTSGIVGLTFVFDVLVAHGNGEVALAMLTKDDQPSFGYMISQGAVRLE